MDNLLQLYADNENELAIVNGQISAAIAELQIRANELNTKNEELKEKIKDAMEEKGLKKYENDLLSITYIAPTTRNTVDSKKLKELYESVYNDCIKTSNVKSSIRIKVKEAESNNNDNVIEYKFDESQF